MTEAIVQLAEGGGEVHDGRGRGMPEVRICWVERGILKVQIDSLEATFTDARTNCVTDETRPGALVGSTRVRKSGHRRKVR